MRIALLASLTICALLFASRPAVAQTAPEVAVYGVLGRWHNAFSSGTWAGGAIGVEAATATRLSAGVDVEFLRGDGALLSLSPTARIRLTAARAHPATVPFVAAGYSYLQFFTGAAHAWHAGAGFEHPLNTRHRVRLEVRGTVRPDDNAWHWTVRAGAVFR